MSLADRKSTRLNSSHPSISYAVFCLKKKLHLCDLYYFTWFDRCITNCAPVLAFDEDPAALRINWSRCGHCFSNHRLHSGFHGQPLRAQAFSDNENKECRRYKRCRNNVTQG